jgi:hypothetical protein
MGGVRSPPPRLYGDPSSSTSTRSITVVLLQLTDSPYPTQLDRLADPSGAGDLVGYKALDPGVRYHCYDGGGESTICPPLGPQLCSARGRVSIDGTRCVHTCADGGAQDQHD